MKFFCSQRDLDKALSIVDKAISSNNTLPVLNNILMKAEGKKVYFSATNLEIAISCSIDADIKNEGKITVPAKLISNYIALLNDEKVELSVNEGSSLSINSSASSTKINCISADEFPVIPKIKDSKDFTVKVKDLSRGIAETSFAASLNTSRPVLSGVFMHSDTNGMKLVATDSYRLAEKKVNVLKSLDEAVSCIIPAKTMIEVGKIVSKTSEKEVFIKISDNQVLFSTGGIELISRLIEGKFPDYEKIIPLEAKTKIEVSAEDLSLVLKRVSLFARENNNSVQLFATNDGKLTVSSDETKVGEEKANVLIKMTGENNQISLNAQYLLDVLTYISDDKVTIYINDKVSPAKIQPAKGENYVYIIMPLKV